ncbi:hypothetical protein RJB92_11475 [Staphylococcus hominis]|uniref:hypothetical protein n=1 Tax=Staphylococcus hominis TaxID=1290 RepID=UPI0028789A9B|nr:hypothetical protein [Staphylococcus hominis]MDS3868768.1 hypothetical protein [Staphylococcus hominis]
MPKVTFFRNDRLRRPEPVTSLANIKTLKEIEFSKDNFQDVPKEIYITNITDPQSVTFRKPKPEDNGGEYKGYRDEDIPYTQASFKALSYDKLEDLRELEKKQPEIVEVLKKELREFRLQIKNDNAGVASFNEVIETARKKALDLQKSKKLKNPVLLLKGCDFAFLPKWEMMGNNGQYKGVQMILRSIQGVDIIEEPVVSEKKEAKEEVSVTDLFS